MKFRSLITLVLAFVTATPALAQGTLEEIVVTAQRREQSLQEVPISITAFSGAALEQAGITSATEYLQTTPNVSFTEDGQFGARGLGISIRGVNNIVTGENAFINSVGIYMDEFSVASVPNQVANPQLPDMERIEILRGPQGTLFGRNSLAGALNITTADPTDEMGGSLRFGGEDYEDAGAMWNATGVFNLPVSDTFKARGVFRYEDSSGLVENVNPAGNDSDHEYIYGRLKAVWDMTPDTSAKVTLAYADEDQGADENVPSGVWDTDTVDTFGLGTGGALLQPYNPLDPNGNPIGFFPDNQNKLSHDLDEHSKQESFVAIVNLTHEFSDVTRLKWVTGIIDAENKRLFDNDLVGDLDLISRTNTYKGFSWSTELRLESTHNSLDWVIGGMYARDDQEQNNNVAISTNPTAGLFDPTINPATGLPQGNVGFLPPFPFGLGLALNEKNFEVEQVAFFADLTFHLSDDLDLLAGGRYTIDNVTNEVQSFGIAPGCDFTDLLCFDPATGPGPLFFPSFVNFPRPFSSGDDDFHDFAPRFGARFKISDDASIYAMLSKGYKAGGVSVGNNTNNNNLAFQVPFKKENLWNYELGFKSELWDNRLRLNGSVFHLEWENLQLESFRFLTPGDLSSNFEQVINVANADANGVELEVLVLPTDQLTLSGGIGWLDTEITSDETGELSGGLTVDLHGRDVPKAPEWTINLAGEYRWPMGQNEAWLRLEYIYRTGQYSDIEALTWDQHRGRPTQGGGFIPPTLGGDPSFPYATPDYDLLNLRAGFDWDAFTFSVFVENLADEEYYTGTQENFGLSGIRLRPHPRYFGGSLSYSWGGI